MKKIVIIGILGIISFISFGQCFNPPKTTIPNPVSVHDTGLWRIDTTNAILKQFYFETCGGTIVPAGYIGWDFDLPSEFGTTDATDTYLHIASFKRYLAMPDWQDLQLGMCIKQTAQVLRL